MEPSDLPNHDDVADQIAQMHLGVDAAELHGSLCGYLSGGGALQQDEWLTQLAIETDDAQPERDSALQQLYRASLAQLSDPQLGFGMLLPDDDASLEDRAEGLLAWCRGFLGGFGLAAGAEPELSPEASEALDDLAKIAASRLSFDDPEGDEVALVEVSEFVRVAALLLHGDGAALPHSSQRLH